MSKKCSLNAKKKVLYGHKVSHSNRKSNRRFLPNLQTCSSWSEVLGKVSLRISTNTIRTIDKVGGIDKYLLATNDSLLSKEALGLKRILLRKLSAAASA
jgi:large subunit ribosomal protein L28